MNTLVWFRNNLRTLDNTILTKACEADGNVIGLYCFDPRHYATTAFGFKKTGAFRAQFLLETINDLKASLSELNISLIIQHQRPENCIPDIVKAQEINAIYYQKEWTSEERDVEIALKENCKLLAVDFKSYYDQFLFHPKDIPFNASQDIPQVFTQFRKACENSAQVREVIPKPNKRNESNLLLTTYNIPTLQSLGLQSFTPDHRTSFPFKGGETRGLQRLKNYHWETNHIAKYKETRNGLVGKDYSSKYSAWLANGSLSARVIYADVKKFEIEKVSNQSTYWMIFELIWRDFFKYISIKHGAAIFKIGGILGKNYNWSQNDKALKDWISGNTKYDFVNANMLEIMKTGWMSNRGRQNVASFWAKELQQDWRVGASYFESMLIDYDVHSNYGNWMYNSGVGNDPRDRNFNIQNQANRYDKQRTYRDLWLEDSLFS